MRDSIEGLGQISNKATAISLHFSRQRYQSWRAVVSASEVEDCGRKPNCQGVSKLIVLRCWRIFWWMSLSRSLPIIGWREMGVEGRWDGSLKHLFVFYADNICFYWLLRACFFLLLKSFIANYYWWHLSLFPVNSIYCNLLLLTLSVSSTDAAFFHVLMKAFLDTL